jgi:putative endonuclease
MYYLYILKSMQDDGLYIGSTNNLKRRLMEHNGGQVFSTKTRVPFELRYYESYFNEADTRMREKRLKQDGRALYVLKARIQKSLQ